MASTSSTVRPRCFQIARSTWVRSDSAESAIDSAAASEVSNGWAGRSIGRRGPADRDPAAAAADLFSSDPRVGDVRPELREQEEHGEQHDDDEHGRLPRLWHVHLHEPADDEDDADRDHEADEGHGAL